MKLYQFAVAISVAGTKHKLGDIVTEADVPPGHLASMLEAGHIAPYVEPTPGEVFAKTLAEANAATQAAEQAASVGPPSESPVIEVKPTHRGRFAPRARPVEPTPTPEPVAPLPTGPLVGPPGDAPQG